MDFYFALVLAFAGIAFLVYLALQENLKTHIKANSVFDSSSFAICHKSDFSNATEEDVNLQFRAFFEHEYKKENTKRLCDNLDSRIRAYTLLRQSSKADSLRPLLTSARKELNSLNSHLYTYNSELIEEIYQIRSISGKYNIWIKELGPSSDSPLKNFFTAPYYYVYKEKKSKYTLIFTPGYVILFSNPPELLRVIKYESLSFKNEIQYVRSSLVYGGAEVVSTHWEHERVNGEPDMRYKKNRHWYTLCFNKGIFSYDEQPLFSFSFRSRSDANLWQKQFNEYKKALRHEYHNKLQSLLEMKCTAPMPSESALPKPKANHTTNKTRSQPVSYTPLKSQSSKPTSRSATPSLKSIPNYTNYKAYKILKLSEKPVDVVVPESIKVLLDGTFTGQGQIKKITFTGPQISIYPDALQGCSSLQEIVFKDSVKELRLYKKSGLSSTPFSQCSRLSKITFGDGLRALPRSACEGLTQLKEVIVSDFLVEVGHRCFYNCISLKHIVGTSQKRLSHLEIIGDYAFYNCKSLKALYLPNSTRCSPSAFQNCPQNAIVQISVGEELPRERTSRRSSSLPCIIKGDTLLSWEGKERQLTIPKDSFIEIGKSAFKNNTALQILFIEDGVTTISSEAFSNCSNLVSVSIPSTCVSIAPDAFFGCNQLKSVHIGDGLSELPQGCFANLKNLKSVILGQSIKKIGDKAFFNCINLETVSAPNNGDLIFLETIGANAFFNCPSLLRFHICDSVTRIDEYAFYNCKSLRGIRIPRKIESLGDGIFAGCSSLELVIMQPNVDWTKRALFSGTPWLKSQSMNDFVIDRGYLEAYVGQDRIVHLPKNITIIGKCAFEGNTAVSQVIIRNSVREIQDRAFAGFSDLQISIPDSVRIISEQAFAESRNLLVYCSRTSFVANYCVSHGININITDFLE